MRVSVILLFAVSVVGIACQPPAEELPGVSEETALPSADTEAIRELSDRYGAVVTGADVDGFLSLLTEDAVLMPPNGAILVGQEAIRPLLEAAFDRDEETVLEEITTPDEIHVAGKWAFDRGITTIRSGPKGGMLRERTNKYIRIWEKQTDASWKLARVIWNHNPSAESKS